MNTSVRQNLLRALAALAVAACMPQAAAAGTMRLADALAIAYATNPQLEAARANARAADEGVAQALAGWRPTVNASGSYGAQHTIIPGFPNPLDTQPTLAQVTVSQPIMTGGQFSAELGRAKALVNVARAQLADAEQSVLLNTVTSYMDVVRDTAILNIHESDVDVLNTELTATQTQQKAGASTRTDVSQALTRLAGARADLVNAQVQLTHSRDGFLRIVGRPPETLEDTPSLPRLPRDEQSAISLAQAQNPRVLAAGHELRATDYAVDDATGALLPHVSIVGQYQFSRDSLSAGLGLGSKLQDVTVLGQVSVPLYQGGAERARIRQAEQQVDQAQEGLADGQRGAEQGARDAWSSLDAARAAIGFNKQRVAAADEALGNVKEEQKGGERSVIDILNAEQDRLSAQIALVSSQHDEVVAAYQILQATGQLTAKWLGLRVKLYDPQNHYDEDAGAWFGFGQ